jgi:hypothetical protein
MSAQRRSPARWPRPAAGLLLIPLLFAAAACSSVAGASAPASPSSGALAGSDRPAVAAPVGAPAPAVSPAGVVSASSVGPQVGAALVGSSGTAVAGSAPAIYPYPIYPGSPGVAPDHTIVVTGSGRADVKADLSNATSAQRDALAAAVADAKAQADVVARAAGVTISAVLSVSVSSGEPYAIPMVMGAGSAPGAAQGGPTTVVPAPIPVEPGPQQIMVTVTVAYRIS